MKAEDTVMEVNAIRELFKVHPRIKTVDDLHGMFKQLAEAQAEISFPLGEVQGRKEVVEWIQYHGSISQFINMHHDEEWEAKLKEWI